MQPPSNEKLILSLDFVHQPFENQVKFIQAGGKILSDTMKALL
jgi:hypothetical protein